MISKLQDKNARAVIIDGRTPKEIIKSIEKLSIEVILTTRCKSIYEAVAFHPDMLLHFCSMDELVYEPNFDTKILKTIEGYGIKAYKGKSDLKNDYPYDIAYNVARVGNNIFHNVLYTDEIIKEKYKKMDMNFIDVKQGYSKCSICVIDDNTIITADKAIHTKAIENHIDSLLISPGNISLPGLNYGFIGGCGGKIANNTILFTGNILKHPDGKNMFHFIEKHNISPICLSNNILLDIGSIIPVK